MGGGAQLPKDGRGIVPFSSYPLVEDRRSVGWVFRPFELLRSTMVGGQRLNTSPEQTIGSYGKSHSHKYFEPSHLVRLDPLGFARRPAEFTLYVICARDLQFAKPRTGKGQTRSGG